MAEDPRLLYRFYCTHFGKFLRPVLERLEDPKLRETFLNYFARCKARIYILDGGIAVLPYAGKDLWRVVGGGVSLAKLPTGAVPAAAAMILAAQQYVVGIPIVVWTYLYEEHEWLRPAIDGLFRRMLGTTLYEQMGRLLDRAVKTWSRERRRHNGRIASNSHRDAGDSDSEQRLDRDYPSDLGTQGEPAEHGDGEPARRA
jgi:hypothetical protein